MLAATACIPVYVAVDWLALHGMIQLIMALLKGADCTLYMHDQHEECCNRRNISLCLSHVGVTHPLVCISLHDVRSALSSQ